MYDIYCIRNLINDKKYFGQTCCGYERRGDQHWQNAAGGSRKCPKLYNSMRFHGVDSFVIELWAQVDSKAAADRLERYWIAEHNTTDKLFGYNQMGGGEGGFLHSQETKTKMSRTATGRKEPEEVKQKLSLFRKTHYENFRSTVPAEEVVALYLGGKTVQDLSKHYGVALNIVGQKLTESGIQIAVMAGAKDRADRLITEGKEHLINPDNRELVRLYESGLSILKLGKMYEMGFQSIFRRLEKSGARLRRRKTTGRPPADSQSEAAFA